MPRGRVGLARPAQPRIGVAQARPVTGPGVARRRTTPPRGRPLSGQPKGLGAPTPTPWDSGAEATASAALLNRENTLAGVRGDLRYTQEQLGLGEFANNPYSQAARLKEQRDIGNRANLNSAGLQLYSGSTINRARGVASAYDRGRQQLEAQLAQAQEAARQREQEAQGTFQDALAQSQEGALDRAIELAPEAEAVGPGRRRRRRRRGR